jgi:hypothetical protein
MSAERLLSADHVYFSFVFLSTMQCGGTQLALAKYWLNY